MKFVTTPNELTIILDRKEQVAAFKAKLSVKKSEATSIAWHDRFSDWRKWEVRLPGSSIPRLLIAGSYWTEEGWDFLYLKKPIGLKIPVVDDVLVIELNGHSRFQRIAVSATKADYELVNKWFGRRDSKAKK